jgi:hypothetical protein
MNLGEYIEILERYPRDKIVPLGLGNPHSWRGSYDELSFSPVRNTTVGAMLDAARSAIGATYTGWKGGDYTMSETTTINIEAREGSWSDNGFALRLLFDLMLGEAQPSGEKENE